MLCALVEDDVVDELAVPLLADVPLVLADAVVPVVRADEAAAVLACPVVCPAPAIVRGVAFEALVDAGEAAGVAMAPLLLALAGEAVPVVDALLDEAGTVSFEDAEAAGTALDDADPGEDADELVEIAAGGGADDVLAELEDGCEAPVPVSDEVVTGAGVEVPEVLSLEVDAEEADDAGGAAGAGVLVVGDVAEAVSVDVEAAPEVEVDVEADVDVEVDVDVLVEVDERVLAEAVSVGAAPPEDDPAPDEAEPAPSAEAIDADAGAVVTTAAAAGAAAASDVVETEAAAVVVAMEAEIAALATGCATVVAADTAGAAGAATGAAVVATAEVAEDADATAGVAMTEAATGATPVVAVVLAAEEAALVVPVDADTAALTAGVVTVLAIDVVAEVAGVTAAVVALLVAEEAEVTVLAAVVEALVATVFAAPDEAAADEDEVAVAAEVRAIVLTADSSD